MLIIHCYLPNCYLLHCTQSPSALLSGLKFAHILKVCPYSQPYFLVPTQNQIQTPLSSWLLGLIRNNHLSAESTAVTRLDICSLWVERLAAQDLLILHCYLLKLYLLHCILSPCSLLYQLLCQPVSCKTLNGGILVNQSTLPGSPFPWSRLCSYTNVVGFNQDVNHILRIQAKSPSKVVTTGIGHTCCHEKSLVDVKYCITRS